MFHQVDLIDNHSPMTFIHEFLDKWVRWAGRPVEVTIDMERSFAGQEFATAMGEVGIAVSPIAGQAHWQHGKIERHNGIIKEMLQKVVAEGNVVGSDEMRWACLETVGAKNSLIREHGFSPNQLLFGRELRCFGELEENGEPCSFHFSEGDKRSVAARRMKFRHAARQSFVQVQASHMLARTVRNRTRAWKEPQIGDRCFFFREVRRKGQSGMSAVWQGPALVVGVQGQSSYWVVFGGRCYLVA